METSPPRERQTKRMIFHDILERKERLSSMSLA